MSKRRRRRLLVAASAVVVMLLGSAALADSYYNSVSELLPDQIATAQATMIMAADGKTQLAQVGIQNRITVPMQVIPQQIRLALVAGQDKDFFDDQVAGSALTREYIKIATGDADAGRLRVAVLARKMEQQYDKLSIMGFYLNAVGFGRGAVGVEKAAQAYFGKGAKDLTVAEAAVLGTVIQSPYGAAPGVKDPETHPDAAMSRWHDVLDIMVEKKWITSGERDRQQFPQVRKESTVNTGAEWGITTNEGDAAGTATGNVVNYVYDELRAIGLQPKELKNGGYRITTTIDPQAQQVLERLARPDLSGSQLHGRQIVKDAAGKVQQDLESAGVVIDHSTGRVLAYYGGLDGRAADYAGVNTGANGQQSGGYPPGTSMEIYTLAAGLGAGASLRSHWKALPFTTDDKYKIGNAGARVSCNEYCTLEYSFAKAYNVPFYWVARQVGPGRVVKTAYQAGIRHMWDDDGREMLGPGAQSDDRDRVPFDRQVGFGQYPITVFDHATGVATMADGGIYNKPHFVLKVEKLDPVTGLYKTVPGSGEKLTPQQVIKVGVANDVTYAMMQAATDRGWSSAQNGREVAAATGAWAGTVTGKSGDPAPSAMNAHAWVVGFSKQFTVAIWTGNAAGTYPVTDPVTAKTITPGTTPYRIWSGFIAGYSTAKDYPKQELAKPSHVGDDDIFFANGVRGLGQ